MRNITLFVLAVYSIAMTTTSMAASLILAADSNTSLISAVATQINDTGLVSGDVAVMNVGTTTPSLLQLQAYDSVLVWGNTAFQDRNLIGNVLADYVDTGGGVVTAIFGDGWQEGGFWDIGGRFETEGYEALGNSGTNTAVALGNIYEPTHAILNGISTLATGYHSLGALNPKYDRIADWTDGSPLVAVTNDFSGTIVSLNMYPSYGNSGNPLHWSGDGARLMANTLNYAAISVPIPATPWLFGSGLLGMIGIARRKKAA